jgi:hypothetical protein
MIPEVVHSSLPGWSLEQMPLHNPPSRLHSLLHRRRCRVPTARSSADLVDEEQGGIDSFAPSRGTLPEPRQSGRRVPGPGIFGDQARLGTHGSMEYLGTGVGRFDACRSPEPRRQGVPYAGFQAKTSHSDPYCIVWRPRNHHCSSREAVLESLVNTSIIGLLDDADPQNGGMEEPPGNRKTSLFLGVGRQGGIESERVLEFPPNGHLPMQAPGKRIVEPDNKSRISREDRIRRKRTKLHARILRSSALNKPCHQWVSLVGEPHADTRSRCIEWCHQTPSRRVQSDRSRFCALMENQIPQDRSRASRARHCYSRDQVGSRR